MTTIAEAAGGFDSDKAFKISKDLLDVLERHQATPAEGAAAASYIFVHIINSAPEGVRDKVRQACMDSIRVNTGSPGAS